MVQHRVQISAWCFRQARKIESLISPIVNVQISLEDHRDPTQLPLDNGDEVDLLLAQNLGPSIHMFLDVSPEKAKEIAIKAQEATMFMLLSFSSTDKPIALVPYIHISDLDSGKEIDFADT